MHDSLSLRRIRSMRLRWAVLAFAGVMLCGAAPASAYGEFQVGAYGGVHLFSPRNELGAFDNDGEFNELKHGGMFGLRGGYLFVPNFGFELELAGIVTRTKVADVTVGALVYRAHVIVNILKGRVRPFLVVGGGGMTSIS